MSSPGGPGNAGKAQIPLPRTGPGEWPPLGPPRSQRTEAPPSSGVPAAPALPPRGSPRAPALPPGGGGPTRPRARSAPRVVLTLGRRLPQGQGGGRVPTCPNSAFVSPIKVKFLEVIKPFCVILPEIQKPERKVSSPNRCPRRFGEVSGRWKFTVQLNMASTGQMETCLPSLPPGV